jgi:hypothetical protein
VVQFVRGFVATVFRSFVMAGQAESNLSSRHGT